MTYEKLDKLLHEQFKISAKTIEGEGSQDHPLHVSMSIYVSAGEEPQEMWCAVAGHAILKMDGYGQGYWSELAKKREELQALAQKVSDLGYEYFELHIMEE